MYTLAIVNSQPFGFAITVADVLALINAAIPKDRDISWMDPC